MHKEYILSFLSKYFFILKAASEGWRICYIGGNQFEFYKKACLQIPSKTDFLKRYTINII